MCPVFHTFEPFDRVPKYANHQEMARIRFQPPPRCCKPTQSRPVNRPVLLSASFQYDYGGGTGRDQRSSCALNGALSPVRNKEEER